MVSRTIALLACLLALAIAGPANAQVGPANAILCNKSASASAAAATTSVVAGVAGQIIVICGYDVGAGAATGSFQLIYGTGGTCTSSTALTGAFTLGINAFVSARSGWAQIQAATGATLCVVTTGTGPTTITVYYAQF